MIVENYVCKLKRYLAHLPANTSDEYLRRA
jgi:hypothetical protein